MKIRKGELILEDEDIDKLVIHKLKEVEDVFENHYEEIENKEYNASDILIFGNPKNLQKIQNQKDKSQIIKDDTLKNCDFKKEPFELKRHNNPQYELDCVELFIKEYFNDLKADKRTHHSIIKQIGRIDNEEIPIILDKNNPSEEIKHTKTALSGVEKYILDKIKCIEDNIDFNKSMNPRVKRCLKALEEEKNKRSRSVKSSKPIVKVLDEFILQKRNNRTGENTLKSNEQCLKTIFEIIDKKYVENINYEDCKKVHRLIYNLPKKWSVYHKNKTINEVLSKPNENVISLTSVKKYLRVFKEFLVFCKDSRYITENLDADIKITRRKEIIERESFTNDELKLIFNADTYPRKTNIYHPYRFWIPLIALYSGMRLNEICQLYCDDIKYEKKIWYFHLTDERDDQFIKNKQSKRDVPIHPKLIELGFIDYVKEVREAKKDRVFYQLQFSEKNHYANMMSGWFARYMKSIGIKNAHKVFHSFRHTVKPALRDIGIPFEYQNAICGWSSNNVGVDVYGGKVPIKKLYEELSRLDYPFLNKNIDEIKKLNDKHKR